MSDLNYRNLFSLEGKTTLITGATGILGRHFSHALASAGADLVLVDLDIDRLMGLSSELKEKYGRRVEAFACDVASPEAVKEMVRKAVQATGKIDVLHNNAATKTNDLAAYFAPCEEYDSRTWEDVMGVNINGMFYVAQAVGKAMVAQRTGGSIIQTSSIYGIMAPDQRIYENSWYMDRPINTPPVYTTSKHAVIGLTRHLATLWASHGIRVNTLALGGVESGQNKEFSDRYSARVPIGRMAMPLDIVGGLVFLASDASRYITGQTLAIDGGLSAW